MPLAGPFEAQRITLVIQLALGGSGWSAASVNSSDESRESQPRNVLYRYHGVARYAAARSDTGVTRCENTPHQSFRKHLTNMLNM